MNKIITIKQSQELDKNSGFSMSDLTEFAGKGIFNEIKRNYKKSKVVVVCGTGNNGADGYTVARYLLNANWDVFVLLNEIPTSENAKEAYDKWNRIGGKSINFKYVEKDTFANCDIIVDAIFGSGLNKKISGEYKRIIELINSLDIPVISIDIPTGINGDTGEISNVAIKATETISFTLPKVAHVILPASQYCGQVKIIDIKITDEEISKLNIRTFINTPEIWKDNIPQVKVDENKYTRGSVLINSGDMYGASILASKSAKKVGAGIVFITCDKNNYNQISYHTISDILKKADTIEEFEQILKNTKINGILLGSGNGKTSFLKEKIFSTLKYANCPIIFDADAISLFEDDKDSLEKLFASIKTSCIFTPHLGEFKRMFDYKENDKIGSVKKASEKSKSIIVLKGHDTIIASPSGEVVINTHSSRNLSIAGSGDVLSGIITGLISRGMDEFKAVCCATWIHGDASLKLNKIFLIEELIDMIDIENIE